MTNDLIKNMIEPLTIHINDNTILNLKNYINLSEEYTNILNSIIKDIPLNTLLFNKLKLTLSGTANHIVSDISGQIINNTISPDGFIIIISDVVNDLLILVNNNNISDISGVLINFIISLMIVILSALTTIKIIEKNEVVDILNKIKLAIDIILLPLRIIKSKVNCKC